jgi:hypothetical protein
MRVEEKRLVGVIERTDFTISINLLPSTARDAERRELVYFQ